MQRKWQEADAWQGWEWEGTGGVEDSKEPVFVGEEGECHKSAVGLGHLWCLLDAAKQEEGRGGCQVSTRWRSQMWRLFSVAHAQKLR